MHRLSNEVYQWDISYLCDLPLVWESLNGRTVAVSGATGMIGTVLIDALMEQRSRGLDISVLVLGRSEARARERFPYFGESGFMFEELDICGQGVKPSTPADIAIHLASTTHPRAYATDPIGTIESNIGGLRNLLEHVEESSSKPLFLFASSVEVYGKGRGDAESFDESYSGDIDCCTLRAGYPEAKRLGEALCLAHASQRGVRVKIPRLPRTYGPTLLPSDTKALSQFIHNALSGEDVVLKSEGRQVFSYLHVTDTVAGLLWVLLKGEDGVAYNVADSESDIALRDLAGMIASIGGVEVRFDLPDAVERAGFSTADRAVMDSSRLKALGWTARYDIRSGLEMTMNALRELWK